MYERKNKERSSIEEIENFETNDIANPQDEILKGETIVNHSIISRYAAKKTHLNANDSDKIRDQKVFKEHSNNKEASTDDFESTMNQNDVLSSAKRVIFGSKDQSETRKYFRSRKSRAGGALRVINHDRKSEKNTLESSTSKKDHTVAHYRIEKQSNFGNSNESPLNDQKCTGDITVTNATNISTTTSSTNQKRNWCRRDFIIGRALGKGKYGNVYKAIEKSNNITVALKVLSKVEIERGGADAMMQFRREVEIHSRLKHKSIINLIGYFHDSSHVYLVLEYCPKGELFRLLQKQHLYRFPLSAAAIYLYEICKAVSYLHERSIIHRDLKCENILLTEKLQPKIADFGFSIHCPSPYHRRKTMCGTMEYMAPELLQGKYYDKSCDIWALGVMAYEFLVGYTPFTEPLPCECNLTSGSSKRRCVCTCSASLSHHERVINADLRFPKDSHDISYDIKSVFNNKCDGSVDSGTKKDNDASMLLPDVAEDFIKQLLQKNPKDRLKSFANIYNHSFFKTYLPPDYSNGLLLESHQECLNTLIDSVSSKHLDKR